VTYPGDINGVGFKGLQDFIRDHRQPEFLSNLSRKLLTYALDRSLQLSDESLIDEMQANLAAQGDHFDALIETIVQSPQFRNKRLPAPPTQIASGKVNQP
jgi:hypothetical protein